MKTKHSLIIAFFLVASTFCEAHTFYWEKVKCPVDGRKFMFTGTGSMTITGDGYADLMIATSGSHYGTLIQSCPKCHYSGFLADFRINLNRKNKKLLQKHLSKYDSTNIDVVVKCQIAAEVKQILASDYVEIASCYLVGSYLLRYHSQKQDLRKEFQLKTMKYYKASYYSFQCSDLADSALACYMIAEMLRRTSRYEEAMLYYDRVLIYSTPDNRVNLLAIKQKKMALEKDDNNKI